MISRRGARLTAEDLPALREFARAYLHEDVMSEYGSAVAAASAYLADASPAEASHLASDLDRLRRAAVRWSAARLATFFTRQLRAAWVPETVDDLERLSAAAHRGAPPA